MLLKFILAEIQNVSYSKLLSGTDAVKKMIKYTVASIQSEASRSARSTVFFF